MALRIREDYRGLAGPEKAAILMLSLSEEHAAKLLAMLGGDEIMREDMAAMGPVRLKDVDEARMSMVQLAKDMAARRELVIASGKGEDELVC